MLHDHYSAQTHDPSTRAVFEWESEDLDTPLERLAEAVAERLPDLPAMRIAEAIQSIVKDGTLAEIQGEANHSEAEIFMRVLLLFGEFTQSAGLISRSFAVARGVPAFKETSETQIAEKYAVGRATISAIVVSIRDRLGIKHTPGLRDDAARQKYADRQRGKKARKPTQEWDFTNVLYDAVHGK